MFRKSLITVLVTVATTLTPASAQEFPGLGVGGLWEMNQQFENQFYPWAWERSKEVAVQTRGQQLPFNAMTISAATSEGMRAFEGVTQNWTQNSNRQLEAVEAYDVGAIRQLGAYGQGENAQLLPSGPEAYHTDAPGYIYEGEVANDPAANMYPSY